MEGSNIKKEISYNPHRLKSMEIIAQSGGIICP